MKLRFAIKRSLLPVIVVAAQSVGLAALPLAQTTVAHAAAIDARASGRTVPTVTAHRASLQGVTAGLAPTKTLRHVPGTASCDTSWRKPVSGDWFNPANWTHGAPEFINLGSNQPTKSACITAAGTYTITVLGRCGPTDCPGQGDVAAGATSLTLGASSGRQTVVVEGSPDLFPPPPAGHCTGPGGQDGFLIVSGDAVVGSHGSLSFSEQSSKVDCSGAVLNQTSRLSVGTLDLAGTLTTALGAGEPTNTIFVNGNIINAGGTIHIDHNTFYNDGNTTPLTFDNAGRIQLADGTFFGDSGQNFMGNTTFINAKGGSIVSSGDAKAGVLRVNGFSPGNSFDQGAGTVLPSGPHPTNASVLISNAPLDYTGVGRSSIRAEGDVSLRGNIARGQNLTIAAQDLCGFVQTTNASSAASFVNAGDITLTQISPCGGTGGTVSLGTLRYANQHRHHRDSAWPRQPGEYGGVPGRKHHKQGHDRRRHHHQLQQRQ